MVKHLIAELLLCGPFFALMAIGRDVSGIVVDDNGAPVELATVVLLDREDSSLVAGTVTDMSGHFSLAYKADCLLRVSCVGFEDFFLANPSGEMGSIRLVPASVELDGVMVKASRSMARVKGDAVSVNVSGTYLANAGTAVDLLGKMPFVTREGNEIEVLGRGAPLIYI